VRWSFKRFLVALAFGVATFVVSWVLGSGITSVLGPGTSGLVTVIFTTIVVIAGARVVEAPGVFTLMTLVFALCAIPTTQYGPPGPQKLVVAIVTGVVYDVIWLALRRTRIASALAAAIATAVSLLAIYRLLVFLSHPRADYLRKTLPFALPLYAILAFIGAIVGEWIYRNHLQNLSAVRQLRA
jgi:hypothetical protein